MRRHFVGVDEAIERVKDGGDRLDRIRRGIHADHRVAAAVEQSLEGRKQDAADVVSRMVRLHANAKHAALAHRVAAARDVANFGGGENQILVAHDLGQRPRRFRG